MNLALLKRAFTAAGKASQIAAPKVSTSFFAHDAFLPRVGERQGDSMHSWSKLKTAGASDQIDLQPNKLYVALAYTHTSIRMQSPVAGGWVDVVGWMGGCGWVDFYTG